MNTQLSEVLVVGGSSGIGEKVCELLTQKGIRVRNISRNPCTCDGVENILCDVSERESFADCMQKALTDFEPEAMVYSAGYSLASPVEFIAPEDYRYLFDVNFFGAAACAQAMLPLFRRNGGGRLVFVSSLGGVVPIGFDAFYSASKAALNMFAQELSMEVEPYNIFVTSFMPGGTKTDFTFKRNVYPAGEVEPYNESLKSAVSALAAMEQGGMTPRGVAEDLVKVLMSDRPPVLYTSGFKNKTMALTAKLLPVRLTTSLTKHKFS